MMDANINHNDEPSFSNRLTPKDWQRIRERHVTVMMERQIGRDLNFLRALALGQALQELNERNGA